MIKLKTGIDIPYDQEFDKFFQALLDGLIRESFSAAKQANNAGQFNELVLTEVMDNCLYVTHQLFEIAKENESLSRFLVTGFLFNSVVLGLSQLQEGNAEKEGTDTDEGIIH